MDEILIKKAQKGDQQSFTTAVLELKDQAYRIAYCYLGNEEDSLDAVCDAVEKALRNIRKLKDPKLFSTWFIRIVINECKCQFRKNKRTVLSAGTLYDLKPSPIQSEDRIDLEQLLNQLDSTDRLLIYLKYYQGYTLDEIAQTTEMPVGTVKTRIYGNLKILRQRLEVREAF